MKWQRVFVTANRIAPEWHVRMQAAFQEHCDSGISKTTNFAYTATVEDVRAIYELAYALHCKGVTVYRDGSRDNQVLSTGATEKAKAERVQGGATTSAPAVAVDRREIGELHGQITEYAAEIERLKKALYEAEAENLQRRAKRARPDKLRGTTTRYETPLGIMFVNITEDERGQPFEVFISLGKAGGPAMADAEAIGRLISLALRSGIPLQAIHRQLRGISSDRAVGVGPKKILLGARRDRARARGVVARSDAGRPAGSVDRLAAEGGCPRPGRHGRAAGWRDRRVDGDSERIGGSAGRWQGRAPACPRSSARAPIAAHSSNSPRAA